MAQIERRLPENLPGEFFVDASCIDCGTCREIAPSVFGASRRGQSFVRHQPDAREERTRALMALVSCPTSSIGSLHPLSAEEGVRAFPEPISQDVAYCGFTSSASYGASSYLISRQGGNVLVDSPRAARPLLERIAERGGLRWMFLTHRDDVAHHARFRERFGCERVIHEDDLTDDTRAVERRLAGGEPVRLAEDLTAIPVPGHTRGSTALLFRNTYLFTGDHLFGTHGGTRLGSSRSYCWYSWQEQIRSMERLLGYRFEWVLPGHGARYRADPGQMQGELSRLIARMRRAT